MQLPNVLLTLLSPAPRQAALGPRTSVFLSDVEAEVWAAGTVPALAARSARWLVTRGEQGADEWLPGQNASRRLPAQKARPEGAEAAGVPGAARVWRCARAGGCWAPRRVPVGRL